MKTTEWLNCLSAIVEKQIEILNYSTDKADHSKRLVTIGFTIAAFSRIFRFHSV